MKAKQIAILAAAFALALPLAAQMNIGPRMTDLRGIWHPVVGEGAAYETLDQSGKKNQIEMTIVGKEDVAGKPGFWMEVAAANPQGNGNVYMKFLVVPGDTGMTSTRTIFQLGAQDPMEFDANMMNRGGRGQGQSNIPQDIHDKANLIGTESVTVPGGTFTCEHYRAKDGTGDVWVSEKVSPWGLVKMQDKNRSMVLTKAITDAKDHITGTPKKFDPMQMMRQSQGQ